MCLSASAVLSYCEFITSAHGFGYSQRVWMHVCERKPLWNSFHLTCCCCCRPEHHHHPHQCFKRFHTLLYYIISTFDSLDLSSPFATHFIAEYFTILLVVAVAFVTSVKHTTHWCGHAAYHAYNICVVGAHSQVVFTFDDGSNNYKLHFRFFNNTWHRARITTYQRWKTADFFVLTKK